MPAALDTHDRSAIVYYAALGYAQQEIADEVGVSRNTVRKYLRLNRRIVEDAPDPRETLAAVIREQYDWERPGRTAPSFGDHPM